MIFYGLYHPFLKEKSVCIFLMWQRKSIIYKVFTDLSFCCIQLITKRVMHVQENKAVRS